MYVDGLSCYKVMTEKDEEWLLGVLDNEVIGNIYENPELLEVEDD